MVGGIGEFGGFVWYVIVQGRPWQSGASDRVRECDLGQRAEDLRVGGRVGAGGRGEAAINERQAIDPDVPGPGLRPREV